MEYKIEQAEDPKLVELIQSLINNKKLYKHLRKIKHGNNIETLVNGTIKEENIAIIYQILQQQDTYKFLSKINKHIGTLFNRKLTLDFDIEDNIDYNRLVKDTGVSEARNFLKCLEEIPKTWFGFSGAFNNDIKYIDKEKLIKEHCINKTLGLIDKTRKKLLDFENWRFLGYMDQGLHQETLKVKASEFVKVGEDGNYHIYAFPELKIESTGRTLNVSLPHLRVYQDYYEGEDKSIRCVKRC